MNVRGQRRLCQVAKRPEVIGVSSREGGPGVVMFTLAPVADRLRSSVTLPEGA